MQNSISVQGTTLDAYIVTSFDEHLNEYTAEFDHRHTFISGFTGKLAEIVITTTSQALWTDERFIDLANEELDCDWKLFRIGEHPTIPEWLSVSIS